MGRVRSPAAGALVTRSWEVPPASLSLETSLNKAANLCEHSPLPFPGYGQGRVRERKISAASPIPHYAFESWRLGQKSKRKNSNPSS